jgi:ADP-dependent NAD(P)H-hydrate dehydratase / NAD(P)H-hydrate epimerase
MKILLAKQIQEVDRLSIEREPISSIDLMERAAGNAWNEVKRRIKSTHQNLLFLCGTGNNGGDGLVMARMAHLEGVPFHCKIIAPEGEWEGSPDFQTNFIRLQELGIQVDIHQNFSNPACTNSTLIIDALFGTGLNRALEGHYADWVKWINQSDCDVISIDVPSGMVVDVAELLGPTVKAHHTLSFECVKFAFLFPETGRFCGEISLIDIGWNKEAVEEQDSDFHFIQERDLAQLLKPLDTFSYKNTRGHVLISGGSKGMFGAPLLSAKAAFRVGAGLVSVHLPAGGANILQASLPDALSIVDVNEIILTDFPSIPKMNSVAIGMGMGKESEDVFKQSLYEFGGPMVIDADALSYLAENLTWISFLPKGSILTPHPGEMLKLLGSNSFTLEDVITFARKHLVYVNLKGAYTALVTPAGKVFFNGTGTPALSVAGTGDVLSGMIAGFLAQGYSTLESALLANCLHGLAARAACEKMDVTSITASDVIEHIGKAIKKMRLINEKC